MLLYYNIENVVVLLLVLPVLLVEERGECNLPNCTDPRYQDPANGRIHLFCTRSHASEAARTGK